MNPMFFRKIFFFFLPISCCFGQFVLRLPVMCVQPKHEAASAQLGLRLLQLL